MKIKHRNENGVIQYSYDIDHDGNWTDWIDVSFKTDNSLPRKLFDILGKYWPIFTSYEQSKYKRMCEDMAETAKDELLGGQRDLD